MSVKIRLRRMGGNNQPFFRVTVTDSRRPMQGRFIESIGWYDPEKKGINFKLDLERLNYWKGQGAEVSDTIKGLLRRNGAAAAAPAAKAEPAETAPAVNTDAAQDA